MAIKIEREDLASLICLTEKYMDGDLKWQDVIFLKDNINKMRKLIKEFDEQQEQKEIGKKWKQQKMF